MNRYSGQEPSDWGVASSPPQSGHAYWSPSQGSGYSYDKPAAYPSGAGAQGDYLSRLEPVDRDDSPRICGLKRWIFWLLVVLAVLIIAGAIGGGVGGSLAANKSSNDKAKAASATPATITVTTSAGGPRVFSSSSSLSLTSASNIATRSSTLLQPSATPPTGSSETIQGTFALAIYNTSTNEADGEVYGCGGDQACAFTLSKSILSDQKGQDWVGTDYGWYSAKNISKPIGYELYNAGWYISANGSLGIGSNVIWYSCYKGGWYYYKNVDVSCSEVYFKIAT